MTIPHSNGTWYTDFISQICRQREATKYLEIGVEAGLNLAGVQVEKAVGVDPAFALSVDPTVGKSSLSLFRMTSDSFFLAYQEKGFDLAFLDGMHLSEYLLRDFYNVEARSEKNGLILIHDCLPFDGEMIARSNPGGPWTGDVWKIVPILEKYRPDVKIVLVDAASTGLVAITNLDADSNVLKDSYLNIVKEFSKAPNDLEALEDFYRDREVVSADSILSHFNQSMYFRM